MIGLLLSLCGCVVEAPETTAVDTLTTVAVVLEPPRPVVGDEVQVDVWVANPDGLPVDVLVWTCVPLAPGVCAEGQLGLEPSERAVVLSPAGPRATVHVELPRPPGGVWEGEPDAAMLVWSLACRRGGCDVVEAVRAGEPDPALHDRLDDPLAWTDLPGLGEAHLGYRRVDLYRSAAAEPNRNPRLWPLVARGERVDVRAWDLDEDDEVEVRTVTTAGAWDDGRWTGGAPGRLFVIASDARDGMAVRSLVR